ncbi:hypothetical protein KUV57_13740 [Epibacterium sp. DP7N7-1]|nr:hypothetical protein [Epibacterium sp. DP7N7-1]
MGISIKLASQNGPYAGRYFISVDRTYKLVNLELLRLGAIFRGTSYILPENAGASVIRILRKAADHDREAASGRYLEEHRLRCEAVEISMLQRDAKCEKTDIRDRAIIAARTRIRALSDQERKILEGIFKERAAEADHCRTIVPAGEVRIGDQVTKGESLNKITELSPEWVIDAQMIKDLKSRFPDVDDLKVGDRVQFAIWPEKEPALA